MIFVMLKKSIYLQRYLDSVRINEGSNASLFL